MPEAQAILSSRGIAPADYEDALFLAAIGDLELLQLLIAAGAGVNCYRFQKGMPLTVAVEAGNREAVRLISVKSTETSSAEFRGLPPERNRVSNRNQYIKGIRR